MASIPRPDAPDWQPTDASELDFLRRTWPMYDIAFDKDRIWRAIHSASRTQVLTAESPAELRQLIRDDWFKREAGS